MQYGGERARFSIKPVETVRGNRGNRAGNRGNPVETVRFPCGNLAETLRDAVVSKYKSQEHTKRT